MLISVIMPAKDLSSSCAQSINSILRQTYSDLELIIVVDGGKIDPKVDISDSRVKCYTIEEKCWTWSIY